MPGSSGNGERQRRPGVSGSKNAGQPSRALGGKGVAANTKMLPGPFNHAWAEGLMELCLALMKDRFFCTARVLVPLFGACASLSAACLFAVWVPALPTASDLPSCAHQCFQWYLVHSDVASCIAIHYVSQHSWYAAVSAASSSVVAFTCSMSAWQAPHFSDTILKLLMSAAASSPAHDLISQAHVYAHAYKHRCRLICCSYLRTRLRPRRS